MMMISTDPSNLQVSAWAQVLPQHHSCVTLHLHYSVFPSFLSPPFSLKISFSWHPHLNLTAFGLISTSTSTFMVHTLSCKTLLLFNLFDFNHYHIISYHIIAFSQNATNTNKVWTALLVNCINWVVLALSELTFSFAYRTCPFEDCYRRWHWQALSFICLWSSWDFLNLLSAWMPSQLQVRF